MTKEPALVFRDKHDPDVVRVEWFGSDGGCELTLFADRVPERGQYGLPKSFTYRSTSPTI
jgi:hypothetical protein